MKRTLIICMIILSSTLSFAGWSYHAHLNYLSEAASILPYFDYEFCKSYKYDLEKGFVEGEIQFKYRYRGKAPAWLEPISEDEIIYLQGYLIDENNVDEAVLFFTNRIKKLQLELVEMKRPYADIMFELTYYLHSINNILMPLYEEGHFPEQALASNTSALELNIENAIEIEDLNTYMKQMIDKKLQIREEWSAFAINNDREGFIKYADEANKYNIYTLSSLLQWFNADCYGPEYKPVRDHLEKMKDGHSPKTNGRKKW